MHEKMNDSRLESEKKFHNKRFTGNNRDRAIVGKFYSINVDAKNIYFDLIKKNCANKKLIEYGCADGLNLEIYEKYGAHLTAIDISEEGIKKATDRLNVKKINADCLVMDVENMVFEDKSFDIATGMGIIHHLDIKKVFAETSRILNSNGHAIFLEPLGHNPFFNFFRKMTPNIRTKDEHPLLRKDLKLLKKFFNKVEIKYFSLFTLLAVPFRNLLLFKPLYSFLLIFDNLFFKIPYLREWAWVIIIHAQKPIKSKSNSKE